VTGGPDLYSLGSAGRTLAAELVRDAATLSAAGAFGNAREVLGLLTSVPLFADAVDADLVAGLLADAEGLAGSDGSGRALALASSAAGLLRPVPADVQTRLAGVLLTAGLPQRAFALTQHLPSTEAETAQALWIAAQSLYEDERFEDALPRFLRGAQLARNDDDAALEWRQLNGAIACHLMLGDAVAALRLADGRALRSRSLSRIHHGSARRMVTSAPPI
jgi:hypothetical protein